MDSPLFFFSNFANSLLKDSFTHDSHPSLLAPLITPASQCRALILDLSLSLSLSQPMVELKSQLCLSPLIAIAIIGNSSKFP